MKKRKQTNKKVLSPCPTPVVETVVAPPSPVAPPSQGVDVWSFVAPALLILLGVSLYYAYGWFKFEIDLDPVIYPYAVIVRPQVDNDIERISALNENGRPAEVDRELHQLKLKIDGRLE